MLVATIEEACCIIHAEEQERVRGWCVCVVKERKKRGAVRFCRGM